jgi:GWxTD domain-containing protein
LRDTIVRRPRKLPLTALLLLWPIHLAGQATPNHAADSTMQAGLVILDQARHGNGRDFDRARGIFRRAHEQAPEWALPYYGIGLAEGGKGDWLVGEPLNLGTRVGHGAYRSAIKALVAATERDPALTAAIVELDRIATALRDTSVNTVVLGAVRRAVERGNGDPVTLMVLGRRERAAGETSASVTTLQRVLAGGTDSSLARFELGRTLLTEGREQGDSLYFTSALSGDSATIAEIRADLVPIAEANELAAFDVLDGDGRELFLRRFWNDRARRDLRSPAERLVEHYRRLRYAREQFALSNNRRYYGARDLYRAPGSETLDDRGVVYVRHGEPDQRLRPHLFGLLPNETWQYRRADGDLLMHFSAGGQGVEGGDLSDYRLVSSIFDLRGNRMPQDMLIASRFEASDMYEKIMSWGPHGRARMIREERKLGERSAVTGTQTDGFELHFREPLENSTDLVAVGRVGSSSRLQLIYGLPAVEAGSEVRLRLALFDSTGRVERWLDSAATTEAMGGGGSGGRFELPAPAGKWYYRFALEIGTAGMVTPRDSVVIPDLVGSSLAVSGIGLGQLGSHIRWVTSPTDTALLSPGREYEPDSELQLYYEIYGLAPRSPFQTSVVVADKQGNRVGRHRLRFTFSEEGQGDITRIRRGLTLGGLGKGEYWLEVRVRGSDGREVTARKWLKIVSVTQ